MAGEKFAFESGEVSVAMFLSMGLGDCVVPRKIFNAVIKLAPRCVIDLFYDNEWHKQFAFAFYSDSLNLNLIRHKKFFNADIAIKYDVVLRANGTFGIYVDGFNAESLKAKSPALLDSILKINRYNERNIKPFSSSFISIALHNLNMARVLGKNLNYFLSCAGALPIQDDDAPYIFLSPKFKDKFDELKLGKYITIYSNINEADKDKPKLKAWPIRHLKEYVALMKENFPQIEVIQCGGGVILKSIMLTDIIWALTWNLQNIFWRTVFCTSAAKAAWFIWRRLSVQNAWFFSARTVIITQVILKI